MIRRLVAGSIGNWHLTLAAFLAVMGAGLLGYFSLHRKEDSEVKPPYAVVFTIFPGAGAERVERLVTRPLEEAAAAIGDIRWISATSRANVSVLWIRLENGVDIDEHWADLRERLAEAARELPEDCRPPEILTKSFDDVTVLLLALQAPGRAWADAERPLRDGVREMRRRVERLPGVARVEIHGEREEEVSVALDLREMKTRRVTLERVLQVLAARNVHLPPGSVEHAGGTVVIETTGTFRTLEEIGATVVDVSATGTPIRLRDLARIRRAWKDPEIRVTQDGSPAMLLAVYPQTSADLVELAGRLEDWSLEYAGSLPPGLALQVVTDQGERIERRVGTFVDNLWQGMLIVMAVAFLLLGVRNALLVSIAVPASCIATLFSMWMLGIEIHQVSLGALVIALGMLVDNAVVVADNITAHLRKGKDRVQAAVDGAAEVNLAILSSTLTTVAAFIPLMIMPGLAGEYIASLPVVVSLALAWSYFFALLVAPIISARVLRPKVSLAEKLQDAMGRAFGRLVPWLLRIRWLLVAAAVAGVVFALDALRSFGVEFFPKAEMDQFTVEIEAPEGSTVERTLALSRAVDERLRREPLVEGTTVVAGRGLPRFFYTHFPQQHDAANAEILVRVRPDLPPIEVRTLVARLNRELTDLPDVRVTARELELGPPVGAPVVVRFVGDSVPDLRAAAATLRTRLLADPDVSRAVDDFGHDVRQVRAVVDDAQLGLAGLTHTHVAITIRAAVEGVSSTTFDTADEEIDVTVRAAPADRTDFSLLEDLVLDSPLAGKVPLRQVARLEPRFEVGQLHRRNQARTLSLKIWSDTLMAAELQARVEGLLEGFDPPPGVRIELGGEAEERDEAFGNLGNAAIVAVFAVLVILVAQFRSYGQALVVLTTIPLTLIGAALGLWLTGSGVGFMAMLGLVSLCGVVVNNAILLLEFVNIGRAEGLSNEAAIAGAAVSRLRPILTTTITTIVGLVPLTFAGGGFWQPMGAVMMGGLTVSTVLTLVVIPALLRIVMGKGKPVAAPDPAPRPAE